MLAARRGPAPALTKSSDFVRAGAGRQPAPAGRARQSSSQPRPRPALARSHPPAAPLTQRAGDDWKFWPDAAWRGHDTTRGWCPRPPWPPGWSPGCPLCPPAPRVELSRAQELRNRNCPCTLGGWPGGPGQAEARGLAGGGAGTGQQQSLRVRGPRWQHHTSTQLAPPQPERGTSSPTPLTTPPPATSADSEATSSSGTQLPWPQTSRKGGKTLQHCSTLHCRVLGQIRSPWCSVSLTRVDSSRPGAGRRRQWLWSRDTVITISVKLCSRPTAAQPTDCKLYWFCWLQHFLRSCKNQHFPSRQQLQTAELSWRPTRFCWHFSITDFKWILNNKHSLRKTSLDRT